MNNTITVFNTNNIISYFNFSDFKIFVGEANIDFANEAKKWADNLGLKNQVDYKISPIYAKNMVDNRGNNFMFCVDVTFEDAYTLLLFKLFIN